MLSDVIKKKEALFHIIRTAGTEILKVYQSGHFQVKLKEDQTPLTIADHKSNEVIIEGLKTLFPNIPFLSEESRKTPYEERKEWDYFWLIDPLDGTKEFIKRNDEFSVNIALVHNNRPVLGLLYLPVLDILYYAIQGLGAFKIDENNKKTKMPLHEIEHNQKNDSIGIIFSKSHFTGETQKFVKKLQEKFTSVTRISVGSAMKLAYLAEGQADIYPRLAPTMEWDTGAGQIIIEEAGGKIIDFNTKKPLVYNKKDLRNPWFIASNSRISAES